MKLTELLDPDELKRTRLRKMKLLAGSFLAVALLIFVICTWISQRDHYPSWINYLKAAADAGMVGGLADWFAVTALFKHPLGLPIPHTAIIPKKKDQLGDTLASFVKDNFLTVETVVNKISASNIPVHLGKWLLIPANSTKVTTEILKAADNLLKSIDTEELVQSVDNILVNKLPADTWSPKLGEYLTNSLTAGEHHPLVQLLVDNIYNWVLKSESKLQDLLSEEAPAWAPKIVKDLVFGKIYAELIDFVTRIKNDPTHQARQALDNYLLSQTTAMQTDSATIDKLKNWQAGLIEKGNTAKLTTTVWQVVKDSLQKQFTDSDSQISQLVANKVVDLGTNLSEDTATQAKANKLIEGAASYLVENYADQILTVISDTIKNWDGKEAATKLELNVGRDLQFIRINGTIVGAIVGLFIYTLSQIFL